MAEFPQIHWKSIDGKNVPFTEPQHFTGDGDEVLRTGENNPLPTKDKEVLSELESIKAENEEIKQKQTEILERLDGTFNTQLTGSNVEDGLPVKDVNSNIVVIDEKTKEDDDLLIPSNTTKTLDGIINVSDYRYLILQLQSNADGKDISYKIDYIYTRGDTTSNMQKVDVMNINNSSSNQVSDKVEVLFKNVKISIRNQEDNDHEFGALYVLGVRK